MKKINITVLMICLFWMACPFISFAGGNDFILKSVSYNNTEGLATFRFNTTTGESWVLGPSGFQYIKENGKIHKSTYQLDLGVYGTGYRAVRIDNHTGDSWMMNSKGMWKKIIVE